MQRVYFVAGAAPLVIAALFGGGTGEAGEPGLLACTVLPQGAAATTTGPQTYGDAALADDSPAAPSGANAGGGSQGGSYGY